LPIGHCCSTGCVPLFSLSGCAPQLTDGASSDVADASPETSSLFSSWTRRFSRVNSRSDTTSAISCLHQSVDGYSRQRDRKRLLPDLRDEFAVLIEHVDGADAAEEIGNRLHAP